MGCGMGPLLVLVSPCFRESAVDTYKNDLGLKFQIVNFVEVVKLYHVHNSRDHDILFFFFFFFFFIGVAFLVKIIPLTPVTPT